MNDEYDDKYKIIDVDIWTTLQYLRSRVEKDSDRRISEKKMLKIALSFIVDLIEKDEFEKAFLEYAKDY